MKRYLLSLIVLYVVYYFAGMIGLDLGLTGSVTCIWPSSGIALAAVLLFGYRMWPAIFLAVISIGLTENHSFMVGIGSGLANVSEIFIAAYLLKKYDFSFNMSTVRDVAKLVGAALIGTIAGTIIGVGSQYAGGLVKPAAVMTTLGAWYIADFLGIILFTPLILVWANAFYSGFRLSKCNVPKFLVSQTILVLVSLLAFSNLLWPAFVPGASAYIVIPPLIWIAFRYRQRGMVIAVFLLSVVAILNTILRFPHEPTIHLENTLFLLQRFLGIASITFMMMAAVIEERRTAQLQQLELVRKTVKLKGEKLQLERVGKTKDEFIAVASHQLRTPATVVKMQLGMLADGMFGHLTDVQHKSITDAYQSNERLIETINDLLGVAQIDMHNVRLHKENTDLQRLVSRVIYHLDPTIAERQQTIKFVHDAKSHIAKVDQGKIAMALENLIDNASKYSQPGKKIIVGLFSREQGSLEIEVRDQGVGISSKDIGRLFQKFSRIDNMLSDVRGGTGLGLYWVKKVVKLHGGNIIVESTPGRGTIFTIRLKRQKAIYA